MPVKSTLQDSMCLGVMRAGPTSNPEASHSAKRRWCPQLAPCPYKPPPRSSSQSPTVSLCKMTHVHSQPRRLGLLSAVLVLLCCTAAGDDFTPARATFYDDNQQ